MATQPLAYLPSPDVRQNHNDVPGYLKWAASTVALAALAYYAPKTFLATSVGIIFYQIYRFNQLVHTADNSKHQEIHAYAITACQIMSSVGAIFLFKSLPPVWSSLLAIRHFHVLSSVGHLAKAVLMAGTGYLLVRLFSYSAIELFKKHQWTEMEDYVEHYPKEIKQLFLSSFNNQIGFFIAALSSSTSVVNTEKQSFYFSQFEPLTNKLRILENYFHQRNIPSIPLEGIDRIKWILAIHHFRELPAQNQYTLSEKLYPIVLASSQERRDQLPSSVKVKINDGNYSRGARSLFTHLN